MLTMCVLGCQFTCVELTPYKIICQCS
jgi:hypothetical protein